MAKVVPITVRGKKKFGVAHETTGKILKRKGRRVIFDTRPEAVRDARETQRRITGR